MITCCLPAVPTCPTGLVYSICSPNLPPTCTNQVGQVEPCRPGCACPDGKVLRESDGTCVDPFLCAGEVLGLILQIPSLFDQLVTVIYIPFTLVGNFCTEI